MKTNAMGADKQLYRGVELKEKQVGTFSPLLRPRKGKA
jgi:hypothetical protein